MDLLFRLGSLLVALRSLVEIYVYSFLSPSPNKSSDWAYSDLQRLFHFADLQVITFNGTGCEEPISTIYQKSCYFHPWGVNVPTTLIRVVRWLGLGQSEHVHIGFWLGTCSIVLIFIVFWSCLNPGLCFGSLFICLGSFPLRLALERGNIDLLILCLMFLMCITYSKAALTNTKPGCLLILVACICICFFAGAAKVYPLVTVPLLVAALTNKQLALERLSRYLLISLVVFLTLLVVSFIASDLPEMLKSSYADTSGGLGYGLQTYPGTIDNNLPPTLIRLLEIFLLVLSISRIEEIRRLTGASAVQKIVRQQLSSTSMEERMLASMYILGSSLLISTYLVFVNGIYRFLLPLCFCMPVLLSALLTLSKSAQSNHKHLTGFAGMLVMVLFMVAVGFYGYRPYLVATNIQHLTGMFMCWVVFPYLIAFLTSSSLGALFTKALVCPIRPRGDSQ